MQMKDVLTFIMAGGKGERLMPLTRDRAKPAVPFGGIYRIIDFTLSNCVNSGIRKIHVLAQYKSISLARHLWMGWNIFESELAEYIDIIHPQQRIDEHWYQGTADSVYQNLYSIEMENPEYVLILAGDHIYKMNYAQMAEAHARNGAEITVGLIKMPTSQAPVLGVAEMNESGRIVKFVEKPKEARAIPGDPAHIYASMGIYFFNRSALAEDLMKDAEDPNSAHDFGKNIVPGAIQRRKVFGHLLKNPDGQPGYWRDVGTVEAYFESNMDLVQVTPTFNLYDRSWPLRTYMGQYPPAKFLHAGADDPARIGMSTESIIPGGCIISGGRVARCVLSPNVRINSFSEVSDSVLMEGVNVGRYAKVRRAIIDKDVQIPPNTVIGYDPVEDRKRFTVTESGLIVVAKGTILS